MTTKTKKIRQTVARLDSIIKEYKDHTTPKKRDWKTYEEQYLKRIKTCFNEIKPLIDEACSVIKISRKEKRGASSKLNLKQKLTLLILKQFCGKSNRCMAGMLFLFSYLSDVEEISYKSIERLYEDPLVQCALFNLHILILKKKGIISADCCGDGTGYAISVEQYYAAHAKKLKEKGKINVRESKRKFIYSFAIMDIKTRMYVGFGTSLKSEKEAFLAALTMTRKTKIKIYSLRLDRYFSCESYAKLCTTELENVRIYLVPKSNIAKLGLGEWRRNVVRFMKNTFSFLKEYFQRNQSESGISEDKKRVGWKLQQKLENRIRTANSLTMLIHNLFWFGADV